MNDEELKKRLDDIESKVSDKGHFWIIIMLIFLTFKSC